MNYDSDPCWAELESELVPGGRDEQSALDGGGRVKHLSGINISD